MKPKASASQTRRNAVIKAARLAALAKAADIDRAYEAHRLSERGTLSLKVAA